MLTKTHLISRWSLLILGAAFLSACTRSIEKADDDTGVAGPGPEEEIIEYELPERDPSINPGEADYRTLANYIVYFDFDSYSIRSSERPKLEAIASWLNNNTSAKIVIAGHTDERGTTQYNLGLGERRSLAARDYLLGLGINASRMSTLSYGEEKPSRAEASESAWTANRRAEVGVLR